jgi:hypothetical protein
MADETRTWFDETPEAMNTRVGKIAQLSKVIRDEFNQRIENGKLGPELFRWLNSLPETQQLLTEKFDRQPVTKSNLSDWRQGGYRDWLKDKAREERIRRLSETGNSLQQAECGDLFENFARIAVAELSADMDGLDDMKNSDARWQRLRELTRELARLQNGYNHSRWAQLAWTKWNDEPSSESDYEPENENPEPKTAEIQPEIPAVVPDRARSYGGVQERYVHHAHCGCVCRKCHPEDGPYPYWDAERDAAACKKCEIVEPENAETYRVDCWPCDRTCQRCDSQGLPEAPDQARRSVFHFIYSTKCKCHGTCAKCHAHDSEYPMAELLRDAALPPQKKRSIIRHADGTSICLRPSYCECACEPCQRAELENPPTNEVESPRNIEEVKPP